MLARKWALAWRTNEADIQHSLQRDAPKAVADFAAVFPGVTFPVRRPAIAPVAQSPVGKP